MRTYAIVGTAAVAMIAGATLLLMRDRCLAGGGSFSWSSASCETARPIILQGDIHRV